MTLSELCKELRNWFDVSRHFDTFKIENGGIDLSAFVQEGQYFRIVGSVFNDGVYQYPATDLHDEEFYGAVWAMAVPADIITLLGDITAYTEKYADQINNPFSSESFGGYTYSKASGGNGADPASWQGHFRAQLNRWRKI